MRRTAHIFSLIVITGVALFATPVFAYSSPGAATGHVNDFAKVLKPETVQSLETELRAFNASTSNEIAVATVPDMGGDYVENYAVKLFEEWGIGKKDKDNGVLIMLAIQERKIRIEVGYGLEGALPDSVAQSIINDDMTPLLKAGDYDGAVANAVHDVEKATQGEYQASGDSSSTSSGFTFDPFFLFLIPVLIFQWLAAILGRSKSWWAGGVLGLAAGVVLWFFIGFAVWLGLVIAGVLTALGLFFDYSVSKAYTASKSSGGSPPWWTGGGSSGGSSGGSFGGFGGGSSGGGGASGGW